MYIVAPSGLYYQMGQYKIIEENSFILAKKPRKLSFIL